MLVHACYRAGMTDMQHRLFVDAGHGEGGALAALGARDPDIACALDRYGPPPDRSLPASFETLARAIVGQQVSRAAASAIWQKMEARGVTGMDAVAGASIEQMMTAGLSRRKAEYLIGIADEITSGRLDIDSLADMPGEDVQKRLVASAASAPGRLTISASSRWPIWMPGRSRMWRFRKQCAF